MHLLQPVTDIYIYKVGNIDSRWSLVNSGQSNWYTLFLKFVYNQLVIIAMLRYKLIVVQFILGFPYDSIDYKLRLFVRWLS